MDNREIRLIQLANYNRPKLVESKSSDWVMNGRNNEFYEYIIDRYNGSPTNSAIINSYVDLIYGRGLSSNNKKDIEILNEITTDNDIRKIVADFELFGEATIQIVPKINKKELPEILHIANEKVIPALEDKEGVINSYWFSKDWKNYNATENKPIPFKAFDGSNSGIQIYKIRPYKAGKNYFSDPDYLAGLAYAEIEENIANFCMNHIQNGLSFGYIINVPGASGWDLEKRALFERKIREKLTGPKNAGKFVLAFNGVDSEVTIVPLNVNDAHKQWDFLTQESRQQILTAHRVTSPMLLGIKDNTGLGNNADELDTAEIQLYKRVIQPKQKYLTDAFSTILRAYDVEIDPYFLPLTEVTADASKSFTGIQISSAIDIITSVNTGVLTEEQGKSLLASMLSYPQDQLDNIFKEKATEKVVDRVEEETATQLKDQSCNCSNIALKKKDIDDALSSIVDDFINLGEEESELEKDFEFLQEDDEVFSLKEEDLNNHFLKMAEAPKSSPQRRSEQDTSLFKIRYKYAGAKTGEREFCKKVIKANRVYRYEDLESASEKVVNAGFGPKGTDTYDIAKYKGGVNCKHFWQRKIYLRRNNRTVKSVNEARRMILDLEPEDRNKAKWVQNPREVAEVASPINNFFRLK